MARSKPCGVCTRRSAARGDVAGDDAVRRRRRRWCRPPAAPGRRRRAPSASAASTRATTSGGVSGRAASCTRTASASPPAAASAARTDAVRVAPPTTSAHVGRRGRRRTRPARRPGRRPRPRRPRRPAAPRRPSRPAGGRPSGTSALGSSAPRRRPLPAAATMPTACTGVVWVTRGGARAQDARLRTPGPRRGGSRPCPRWCPRRARAR